MNESTGPVTATGEPPTIYIYKDLQQYGPYPESTVSEWLRTGQCLPDDLGWRAGMKDWQTLAALLQLGESTSQYPAFPCQEISSSPDETSTKPEAAETAISECNVGWSPEATGVLINGGSPIALSRSRLPDNHIGAVRFKVLANPDEILVVNATERKTIDSIKAKTTVRDIHFSHDGSQMAVCLWSQDSYVEGFILNGKSKQRIGFPRRGRLSPFGQPAGGSKLCSFSPDDSLLAVASDEDLVTIMTLSGVANAPTLTIAGELQSKQVRFTTKSLEWSPDGSLLAQAGWGLPLALFSGERRYAGVLLWRFEKGAPLEAGSKAHVLKYPSDFKDGELPDEIPFGMAFVGGSRVLAVGSEHSGRGSTIKVFNLETNALLCESANIGSRTTTIVQSPRDDYFFSGGVDGVLRMWRLSLEEGTAKLNEVSGFQFRGSVLQCLFCEETNSLLVAHFVPGDRGFRSILVETNKVDIRHLKTPLT